MQFIPSTAQDVANQLGWENYTVPDLYRPVVSITFGTHYLSSMRDFQGGSEAGALLSYNAGPGTAQSWLSQSGGDIEALYDLITFDETKSYLDLIYVNYFMYQHLYTENPPNCDF
jgi:soluble lytic murein transglycosylase